MVNGIGILMLVMIAVLLCGLAGHRIAKEQGRNPIMGLLAGAALPLVGVGIMLFLGDRKKSVR